MPRKPPPTLDWITIICCLAFCIAAIYLAVKNGN